MFGEFSSPNLLSIFQKLPIASSEWISLLESKYGIAIFHGRFVSVDTFRNGGLGQLCQVRSAIVEGSSILV